MVTANDVRLVMTCQAYPEQYDGYVGDEPVAYLRLRNGVFTAQCPHIDSDPLGFLVNRYVYAERCGHGEFYSDVQRRLELDNAREAIAKWYNDKEG